MKKSFVCLFILVPALLLFGCANSTKTLARNLDSTITNLIYSVSNLDLIDSNTLNNVSMINASFNNLNQESRLANAEIDNDDFEDKKQNEANKTNELEEKIAPETRDENNANTPPNQETPDENNDFNFDNQNNFTISSNDSADNNEINNKNETEITFNENKIIDNSDNDDLSNLNSNQNNENSLNNNNNQTIKPPFKAAPALRPNRNFKKQDNNQQQMNHSQLNTHEILPDNNQSISDFRLSKENEPTPAPKSHLFNQTESLNNPNNDNKLNSNVSVFEINEDFSVPSTYDSLKSSSEKITELINDLVNKRTVIMLYISDLYNGEIILNEDDTNAIISYTNIIKEATAFLKSNRGIVANHLNEASLYLNGDSSASVANSHLIRAAEALLTRCAKLESAIMATSCIAEIIKENLASNESAIKSEISEASTLDRDESENEASAFFEPNSANFGGLPYLNYNYPYYQNMGYNNFYPYSNPMGEPYGYGYGFNMNFNPYNNGYGYPYGANFGSGMNWGYPFSYGAGLPYYENGTANYGYGANFGGGGIFSGTNNGIFGGTNGIINEEIGLENMGLNNGLNSPNSAISYAPVPNILSGLASLDEQEHLNDAKNENNQNFKAQNTSFNQKGQTLENESESQLTLKNLNQRNKKLEGQPLPAEQVTKR